ncbi:MAG: hemolysin III family protein [Clostridiales bacterium]|nr:hemolysin III family protein [Clostridiales bacterium]
MLQLLKKTKDPGSALTHLIGVMLSIIASILLITRSYKYHSLTHTVSITIFSLSLILLYTASTLYHTFNLTDKINSNLRKFDHMMIYCLISGTYTPVCLTILKGPVGYIMLAVIWSMAIIGMFITIFIKNPRKWISAIIYIVMGWTCIFALNPLYEQLSFDGFLWLLLGGIFYTIGGIIYALKLPIFNNHHHNFGNHEIFHVFVLIGSFCHVIFIFNSIIPIPV